VLFEQGGEPVQAGRVGKLATGDEAGVRRRVIAGAQRGQPEQGGSVTVAAVRVGDQFRIRGEVEWGDQWKLLGGAMVEAESPGTS
jgi:hypothetical protein